MPQKPKTHHQRQLAAGRLPKADELRGSAYNRGYDADWRRLRDAFIRERPLCVFCGHPAAVVDHIVPVAVDPMRRLDVMNLRPVCVDCHALLTTNFKKTGRNEMPSGGRR